MDVNWNYVFQAFVLLLVIRLTYYIYFKPKARPTFRSVAILVLGDVGRSPRMMYHAQSFADEGFRTFVVGYSGSQPLPSLLSSPHVHFLYLSQPPAFISKLPRQLFLLLAPFKVLHQTLTIILTLLVRIPYPPQFILVQNPPTIPTLALVWLVARLRGSKVIIDWHNLGYSILALKLGKQHPLVFVAKKFEQIFGRNAYAHLFVTKAMHEYLTKEWDLRGIKVVLHDRPPSHFGKSSPAQVHDLFLTLTPLLESSGLETFLPSSSPPNSTTFTTFNQRSTSPTFSSIYPDRPTVSLRSDRPALLVSSTSWTPDEDFGILIKALSLYEKRAEELSRDSKTAGLPKALVLVTGKGPLRNKYMQELQKLEVKEEWKWVRCRSLWLEAEQYPILLGSADVGISLHSSSSGLDLPMKVVDMFGCQLPVCALNFACLDELVKDGKNGLIFNNADELASRLEYLLSSFPTSEPLDALRSNLERRVRSAPHSGSGLYLPGAPEETWGTWQENWSRVVKPLLSQDLDAQAERWLEANLSKHGQVPSIISEVKP